MAREARQEEVVGPAKAQAAAIGNHGGAGNVQTCTSDNIVGEGHLSSCQRVGPELDRTRTVSIGVPEYEGIPKGRYVECRLRGSRVCVVVKRKKFRLIIRGCFLYKHIADEQHVLSAGNARIVVGLLGHYVAFVGRGILEPVVGNSGVPGPNVEILSTDGVMRIGVTQGEVISPSTYRFCD